MLEHLPPERREYIEEQMAAQEARDAVRPEFEQQADGSWLARKLGCVGMGASRFAAAFDVNRKVELAYGAPEMHTEAIREREDAQRPATERIVSKLGDMYG